jgi:hypothetical protein
MRIHDDGVHTSSQALQALASDPGAISLSIPQVLGPDECQILRSFADSKASECETVDAMDGENESQTTLSKGQLEDLIGKETVSRIWALPQQLELVRPNGKPNLPPFWLATISVRLTQNVPPCSEPQPQYHAASYLANTSLCRYDVTLRREQAHEHILDSTLIRTRAL